MELASTINKIGSRKLGYAKIDAEAKARLSLSNASEHALDQTKGTRLFQGILGKAKAKRF